jgi:hypothetical protein
MASEPEDAEALIGACRLVDGWLRHRGANIKMDDPRAVLSLIVQLTRITTTAVLAVGRETGRTEDEARGDALAWLAEQTTACELELLDSGRVYDPATSIIGDPAAALGGELCPRAPGDVHDDPAGPLDR